MGQVHGVGVERLQLMLAPGDKRGAHSGRCTKQVQEQKSMAAKIADQAKVRFATHIRQRPVVVNARNGLHAPSVAVTQTPAVNRLGLAHIGTAVLPQRNGIVLRQPAGHAGDPHHFVPQLAHGELLDARQFIHTGLCIRVHAGDEFQLRLTEVGGDVGVRQGRTQTVRMRSGRQHARGKGAQAFFFHTTANTAQTRRRQRFRRQGMCRGSRIHLYAIQFQWGAQYHTA